MSCLAFAANAQELMGRITATIGGDSLKVADGRSGVVFTVQIAGIEAPDRFLPHGRQSGRNLGALAFGRNARVEVLQGRAQSIVGRVLVPSPDCQAIDCPRDVDLGLEQVRAGMAWWAARSVSQWTGERRAEYEQAEFYAKTRRLGLWAFPGSLPPWQAPGRR